MEHILLLKIDKKVLDNTNLKNFYNEYFFEFLNNNTEEVCQLPAFKKAGL
tara:strand:+ start:6047 stop:6196 length:150 start_codon:yes stop_codon:yes gene_type:complete